LCSNVTIDDVLKWLECPGIDINHMNVFTALTSAATKDNLDVLNVLIANGADVESTTMFGQTPLMAAALYGHVDIIKVLLKKKAKVNTLDLHGASALHLASKNGNVEIIQHLIDSGEILDLDAQTNLGMSPLVVTSVYGHLSSMKLLIANGANVHKVNGEYGTPLHQAAALGHLNMFEYLLFATTLDINLPTISGVTPLMLTAEKGQFEFVKALLQEKAEVNAQMNDGLSALHLATANIKIVEILYEHGANIDIKSDSHGTPMTRAVMLGHLDVVKYLIEKKADINITTLLGETPLMLAAEHGQIELVKALLQKKAEVNAQTNDGLSALHLATSNIAIVEILIEHEANVNLKSEANGTPIFMAAGLGHFDVVQYLIKKKAEINLTTTNGTTPLMTAASRGYFEIVKALLGEKAEVNAQINGELNNGLSALHLATANIKIVEILYEHGANIDIKSDSYGTPFTRAVILEHFDVVEYLIKKKADINATTPDTGATPLMNAVKQENFEIIKALLREKAEVNAQMNHGLSALHLATANITIVEMLIEHGANVNMKSEFQGTPIYTAARSGHLDVVQYLIEKKADINVTTLYGGTPLMVAAEQGHFEIVKELQKANSKFPILKQRSDGQSALSLAELNGHTVITEFLCEIKDEQNNAVGKKVIAVGKKAIAVGKKAMYFLLWFMVISFVWNLFFKQK